MSEATIKKGIIVSLLGGNPVVTILDRPEDLMKPSDIQRIKRKIQTTFDEKSRKRRSDSILNAERILSESISKQRNEQAAKSAQGVTNA